MDEPSDEGAATDEDHSKAGGDPGPAASHDDGARWVDADIDQVDAALYQIQQVDISGELRLVATGPCPGCGSRTVAVRDEVDWWVPPYGAAGAVVRGAARIPPFGRILGNTARRGRPTRVQFAFVCKCPYTHAGNPDEKNPRGCGRSWSLVAQEKRE